MTSPKRSRRDFIRTGMAACGGAAAASAAAAQTQDGPDKQANLVFVFSDQQAWDMLGCYGNADIQTPNFDRFAAQGVRFNHCVSNSPVCTPYRGILMSGQHPLYCGAMTNDVRMLAGNGTYLGERLRDAGYRMGYYGKWHLYGGGRVRPVDPGPYRYGFDHEFLTNNCTLVYDKERAYYWDENGERQLYGDWEPYAQTRQAMDFVDRHANDPFALFLSWHPPHNWGRAHAGYSAPEDCLAEYDPAAITLRPTAKDTPENRMRYQGHMAMVTSLDRAFGWLMDTLEEKGLTDNTLVVFTSDHGDMLMSHDWPQNKGRPEHDSCRVPMLMRWPGRLNPGTNDTLLGTLDLMPTLLGMLGLDMPGTCQGINCAPAIEAGRDAGIESQPLFFLPGNWRGAYTRRYTYSYSVIEGERKGFGADLPLDTLYDRQEDPWETRNLYDDAGRGRVREELHALTRARMAEFGDTGFRYGRLWSRVLRDDDARVIQTPPPQRPPGWECRLKGRPVDYLPPDGA